MRAVPPEDTTGDVASRARCILTILGAGAFVLACREEQVDDAPERVVEELIERMQSVHGDPKLGAAAYELLWSGAKENLEERARRASAASGRPVKPEEMLVPSRFSLRFEPKTFTPEIKGRFSRVTVTGEEPSKQLVEVRCVKEEGKWRVMLELPPPPPIESRERDQTP